MSGHAETALDQLRLADDLTDTREQAHANALAAAQVHALLAVAEAVREEFVVIDAAIWHETENRPLSQAEYADLAAEWAGHVGRPKRT